jgi:hypothetical protein
MSNNKCVINLGLYRTGTTTLAKVVQFCLGGTVYRDFPSDLSKEQLQGIITNPEDSVVPWWFEKGGKQMFLEHVQEHNCICDGWTSLLIFLPFEELKAVKDAARLFGKSVAFVVTTRDENATILSELHHWVRHDLERKTGLLDLENRSNLEQYLRNRWLEHKERFDALEGPLELTNLPLEQVDSWSNILEPILDISKAVLDEALLDAGTQNQNPPFLRKGFLSRVDSRMSKEFVTFLTK